MGKETITTTKDDRDDRNYDLIKEEDSPTYFHIGQCYEDLPAKKLACAVCGNDKFVVGSGSYYTAIACDTCKWELCLHDG